MSENIQEPQEIPIVVTFEPVRDPVSDAQVSAWQWKNEITPRLAETSIDARFWRDVTDWGSKPQENAYLKARRHCAGNGAIVALVGSRGSGKTTIAAQMIVDRVKLWAEPPHDSPPPYRKCSEIVAKYKSIYADYGSTDTERLIEQMKRLCAEKFLVIDELHECDDQKMKTRVLTDILDRRYAKMRDTLIISNQTPQEFQATTSDSILSRMSEHGAIIPCNWKSWRTSK